MLEALVEPEQNPQWVDFDQVLFIALRAFEHLIYTYDLNGSMAWNGSDAVLEIDTRERHTVLTVLVPRQPSADGNKHRVLVYVHRTLGGTRYLCSPTDLLERDLTGKLLEIIREVTSYGYFKYMWYRCQEMISRSVWEILAGNSLCWR